MRKPITLEGESREMGKVGNGVRLRYFLIFRAALDRILFQPIKSAPEYELLFSCHRGRLPIKGRRNNT